MDNIFGGLNFSGVGKMKEDNGEKKTVSWASDAQEEELHPGFSPVLVCKQLLLLLPSVESFSQSRGMSPEHPIRTMLWHGSWLVISTPVVNLGVNLCYGAANIWQCDVNGAPGPVRPSCQGKVRSA